MRKVEAITIGEYTYHCTQMGAIQGRDTLARLLAMMGPLFSGNDGEGLKNLKPEDLQRLCEDFSKLTEVEYPDGKRPMLSNIFDLHFVGLYDEMFDWLMFCIKLNFQSFFAKALAKIGVLATGLGETQSKSVSTPASGGSGA